MGLGEVSQWAEPEQEAGLQAGRGDTAPRHSPEGRFPSAVISALAAPAPGWNEGGREAGEGLQAAAGAAPPMRGGCG